MNKKQKTTRPSLFWLLTEGGRAMTEMGVSIPYRTLFANKGKGDGHPVFVIPGFMSTDYSTLPLRKYLKHSGYSVYRWGLGRNTADVKYIDLLLEKVDAIYAKHNEKISLIGWSLGGVFARQIAKSRPDAIRQVITMASPFKGVRNQNNVAWLYNLITNKARVRNIDRQLIEDIPLPAPVPTTAIYTKQDGIVPWQLCLEDEDEIHQNVQVRGSHFGLGVNPTVLEIIVDRLQYSEENWVPFQPNNMFTELLFYPSV